MADVGTGSGVIAISLALEKTGASITASDVSSAALELARENASRLGASIDFIESDLLPPGAEGFDAIVANLPYIAGGDLPSLSREVRHDPSLALDGGPDGMAIMMRLIPAACAALAPGGLLALEIGSGQEGSLLACLQENNYRDIEALPDYQGHIRFLMAKNG
jgi:release factor glutamine methyltransferase